MYTHKVNILYYNVYTSFWDTLYVVNTLQKKNYRRLKINWYNIPKVWILKFCSCHEKREVQEKNGSRGSSVGIVSDYGLDDRGSIPDRGFLV
jgi:hypothetical protein